jgi:hypothetical protein
MQKSHALLGTKNISNVTEEYLVPLLFGGTKVHNAEHHTSRLQFQYAKLLGFVHVIHNNYYETVDKVITRSLLLVG